MTLIHQAVQVPVYANWGRWVANCPVCESAEHVYANETAVQCNPAASGCGIMLELVWPTFREGVERLLMMRPAPKTRNWLPGESLHDLLAENVEHGIGPLEPGQDMLIIGDTITRDTLPTRFPLRQIGGQ